MIKRVVERFPNAQLHYEGIVDEETVLSIKALVNDNPFVVWIAMPSELTSWVKRPMASPELCKMVKRHAKLGLWILETQEQLEEAKRLGATSLKQLAL